MHDLHIWTITSGREALSAHVIHADAISQPVLLKELRTKLHDRFGVDHLTLQMETSEFEDDTYHFCHAGTACFRSDLSNADSQRSRCQASRHRGVQTTDGLCSGSGGGRDRKFSRD